MRLIFATILAFTSMLIPASVAYADSVPPGTGCCFSFDKSPVNVIFCMTPNACQITTPKP